ncbi:MAG: hypothetical protein ACRDMX_00210 [Solirubrobacteraceae bacterium]
MSSRAISQAVAGALACGDQFAATVALSDVHDLDAFTDDGSGQRKAGVFVKRVLEALP